MVYLLSISRLYLDNYWAIVSKNKSLTTPGEPMLIEQTVILRVSAAFTFRCILWSESGGKISLIMGLASGSLIIVGDLIVHFNKKAGLLFLMIITAFVIGFVQKV